MSQIDWDTVNQAFISVRGVLYLTSAVICCSQWMSWYQLIGFVNLFWNRASRIFSLLSLSLPSKPPTIWDLFETGSKSLTFNETYWPILQWQWGRKHGLHSSLPWTCTGGDLTLYYTSPTPSLVSPCPCLLIPLFSSVTDRSQSVYLSILARDKADIYLCK